MTVGFLAMNCNHVGPLVEGVQNQPKSLKPLR